MSLVPRGAVFVNGNRSVERGLAGRRGSTVSTLSIVGLILIHGLMGCLAKIQSRVGEILDTFHLHKPSTRLKYRQTQETASNLLSSEHLT